MGLKLFKYTQKIVFTVIIASLFSQSNYHATALVIQQLPKVEKNIITPPLGQNQELSSVPAQDSNTPLSTLQLKPSNAEKKKVTTGEDISKRTEYTKTIIEEDGKAKKQISLVEPLHYKKDGKWEKLNPKTKKNDQQKSIDLSVGDLVMKAKPLNKGIEYVYKGKTFSVTAKGASGVMPKLSRVDGNDIVLYENVFPSVDIRYQISGYSIKEFIVLKDKSARATFDFTYKGIKLKDHSTIKGALAIEGLSDSNLYIAPLNISTSKSYVTEPVVSQGSTSSTVTIKVDSNWLQGLTDDQFPVEIDPTWKTISKQPQDMMAVRSDGYRCGSNTCSPTVGVEEYPDYFATWRTLLNIPFEELQEDLGMPGAISARLKLVQNGGVRDDYEVAIAPAGCWDYNCAIDGHYDFESPNNQWVDVSYIVNWMHRNDMRSSPIILYSSGENIALRSAKTFDLSQMILEVTYLADARPPTPTPVYPLDKKVISNLQPTLTVNPVTDPDGEQVRYVFCLMSDPKNYITCSTTPDPHWTVPDGLLNDGVTYYWYAEPAYGQATPPPTNLLSFKVDLRLGKDSTQSYDTAGPASIDLATGNLSTSISSHALKTLGGDLGVSLDYNTPAVSRPGLVAEYWNNTETSGTPHTTTVTPTIDFNWRDSSPIGYPAWDNFSARYSGYLTVPATGNYVFGVKNDDIAKVYINDQLIVEGTQCCDTAFGQAVSLTAGRPAKIKIEYVEQTGNAQLQLFAKSLSDPNDIKVVDRTWLQTGIKSTSDHGLIGDYYNAGINHTFPGTQPTVSVKEPDLDFENSNGLSGRVPGGVITNIARYRGVIEVPSTGSYKFSAVHSGGLRLKINNQTLIDNWERTASYSEAANEIQLTKDQLVPIEVEYFDDSFNRPAKLSIQVEGSNLARQTVPSTWLSRAVDVLPSGWKLGATGDTANFDRLSVNSSSVTLSDSSGSTHEYKWENNTFVPPAGEHGILNRNNDGTYTFKDDDGRLYLFSVNGNLTSMTAPTDDKKPTAIKYTYSGSPARLTKISDGVNANRYATLYYAGVNDTNGICNPPSGWDAAPVGYLCKVQTSDGTFTALRYKSGNLARVEGAGSSMTDFGYDSMKRITQVRDPLANDALQMGVRTASDFTTFDVSYDEIGRVGKVTYPAAVPGASRLATAYKYLVGATEVNQEGASEPNGYSQRIEYDDSYRTVRTAGLDGLASTTQWDAAKDIVHSTTDPLGLKSTTIRDTNDRPIASYGPAPADWFGTDNIPKPANATGVPKTETKYDEGMQGMSASFYDNKHLVREPKARTFERGDLMRQWNTTNRPVTPTSEGWGVQLTGEAVLPEVGSYTFKLYSDDGVKLYINDRLYTNDWTDGEARYHESATYDNAEANKRVKLRIEYYDKDQNDPNSKLELRIYKPGSTEEQAVQTSQFLVPDFSLPTNESVTDSTLGKVTNTKIYNRPEYGVLDKIVLDPGYFNYASTTTTETPGAGFFRQTSKTLPGGNKTNYHYYASYDTRDNPCTPETEAAIQAGMPKGKTEPDPDGAGPQIAQTSEMIYDQSGQVVAARINNEPYTCTKYDTRGRVLQTITPTHNGRPGMTSNTNYSVGGNPLKIATTDSNGAVTTELDLLGRTTKYTDVYGKVTTPTYDAQGRITAKSSPIGAETFSYDALDRLTSYAINGVVMAKPYYDSYSRIKNIDYPASNQKLISLEYDSLLRVKAMTWKLGDGTVVKENQAKSSTGLVVSNSRTIGTEVLNQNYTYDKAARLRTATVGAHTMTYNFDAPPTSCGASHNPLAHRNANRTSQVIDGITTTYCYDFSDRLISSSDANYDNPIYDDRGNITQIGSTDKPIKFSYDQANRNIRTEQRDEVGNGTITEYKRDAGGRMLARKEIKLTNNTVSTVSNVRYGYTTGGDSPDIIMDGAGGMIQRSLSLPGGVMLALNSNQTETAKQRTYSIPNFHGDTMITTDYNGNKTGVFTYDPFGNQLDAVTPPQTNAPPGTTYGYLGANTRPTETPYSIPITQMGDRIYLPGLGRFIQPDPVEGGNANAYIYPADPVNGRDLDGRFAWFVPVVWFIATAIISAVVVHVANKIIDKVVPPPYRAPAKTAVTIASFASAGGATRTAVSKAPVYIPKIQKQVKNVLGNVFKYTHGSAGGATEGKKFSVKAIEQIKEKNNGRCVYCGTKDRIEADHIWARSTGGNNTLKNGQPACRTHNASKGAGLYPKDTTIGQLGLMICIGRGYLD